MIKLRQTKREDNVGLRHVANRREAG